VADELGIAEAAGRCAIGTFRVLVMFEICLLLDLLTILALDVKVQAALARVLAHDGLVASRVGTRHQGLVAVSCHMIFYQGPRHYKVASSCSIWAPHVEIVELVVDNLGCGVDVGCELEGQPVDRADGVEGVCLEEALLAEDVVAGGDDGLDKSNVTDWADEVLVDGIFVLESS